MKKLVLIACLLLFHHPASAVYYQVTNQVSPGSGTKFAATLLGDGSYVPEVSCSISGLTSMTVLQGTNPWVTSRNWNLNFASDKSDVSGSSVSVSNFPASQPVSGSVSVSNFPATQPVSGSIGRTWTLLNTTDSVNVGNFPATQPISGSVSVSNFPATQPISGTVTSNQGTANTIANAWPVKPTDGTNTAGYTSANAAKADIEQILGSAPSATNYLPSRITNGAAYVDPTQIRALTFAGDKVDTSGSTNTCNAGTNLNTSALALSANQTNGTQKTQVVDGSGSVIGPSTTLSGVNYQPVVTASSATAGSPVPARSILVSGKDGSGNAQSISVDSSGRINTNTMDGAGNSITSTTVNGKTGLSNQITGADSLNVTGSASALNGTPTAATDVSNYRCASVQKTVAGTNTEIFEESNDGVTYTSAVCSLNGNIAQAPLVSSAAGGLFSCPIHTKFFRTRISAFTSGSTTDNTYFFPVTCESLAQRAVSVTGTATISGSVNQGIQVFGTQVASAARTTTGNSGFITQGAPNNSSIFAVLVTAVSGTNPTLDVTVNETADNGVSNLIKRYDFDRITATGQFQSGPLQITSNKFELSWVIGGTTPSFTFSIASLQGNTYFPLSLRLIDRTIVPATAASTSSSLNIDGCKSLTAWIDLSAVVAAPTFSLDVSEDGTKYAPTGVILSPTTAAPTQVASTTSMGKLARLRVVTADAAATLNFASIRCTGN